MRSALFPVVFYAFPPVVLLVVMIWTPIMFRRHERRMTRLYGPVGPTPKSPQRRP